jgi:hypothetical protein
MVVEGPVAAQGFIGRMSSRSPFAATCDELAMTSASVPRTLSTTPKRIVAAILAVRNIIMSRLPRTLQRYCCGEGSITIVLCQYLLIGSAREGYIKKIIPPQKSSS